MASKNITENVTTLANFHSNAGSYRDSFLSDQNKEMVFKNTNSYMWSPNRYYNGSAFTYLSSTWLNLTATGVVTTVDLTATGDIAGVNASFTGDLYSDSWAFYNDQNSGFFSSTASEYSFYVGGSVIATFQDVVGDLFTSISGFLGINTTAVDCDFEIFNPLATVDFFSQIISTANYNNPFTDKYVNSNTCFSALIKSADYGGIQLCGSSSNTDQCGHSSALDLVGLVGQEGALSDPVVVARFGKKAVGTGEIADISAGDIGYQIRNNETALVDFYGDGEIETFRGGLPGLVNRTLWIKTSDTTVANTTSETSIGGTIVTFPANFLTLNKAFRLRLAGQFSTKASSAGTMTVKVKLGSTIIAQSAAFNIDNNLTNQFWELGECCYGVRSVGATGTIMGQCGFKHSFVDAGQDELHIAPMVNTSPVTIDTTASLVLTVTVQFSVADVANTITCTCGHVDEVY